MTTATLSSKGQLVIPKPVREHLRLHPGDDLDFVIQDSGEVCLRPAVEDVRGLKGLLHRAGQRPVALTEMKAAVKQRGGRRS